MLISNKCIAYLLILLLVRLAGMRCYIPGMNTYEPVEVGYNYLYSNLPIYNSNNMESILAKQDTIGHNIQTQDINQQYIDTFQQEHQTNVNLIDNPSSSSELKQEYQTNINLIGNSSGSSELKEEYQTNINLIDNSNVSSEVNQSFFSNSNKDESESDIVSVLRIIKRINLNKDKENKNYSGNKCKIHIFFSYTNEEIVNFLREVEEILDHKYEAKILSENTEKLNELFDKLSVVTHMDMKMCSRIMKKWISVIIIDNEINLLRSDSFVICKKYFSLFSKKIRGLPKLISLMKQTFDIFQNKSKKKLNLHGFSLLNQYLVSTKLLETEKVDSFVNLTMIRATILTINDILSKPEKSLFSKLHLIRLALKHIIFKFERKESVLKDKEQKRLFRTYRLLHSFYIKFFKTKRESKSEIGSLNPCTTEFFDTERNIQGFNMKLEKVANLVFASDSNDSNEANEGKYSDFSIEMKDNMESFLAMLANIKYSLVKYRELEIKDVDTLAHLSFIREITIKRFVQSYILTSKCFDKQGNKYKKLVNKEIEGIKSGYNFLGAFLWQDRFIVEKNHPLYIESKDNA
ncbi:uncharacterized protein CMU_008910 [Cryptosporidium muris RN66]|uniref:Uncharacterized protein n=1 Tax=Cryptosporidium muris (strain RN66) TaxID=441375 RepID=B6ADV8_CRYMR|nr:uncharacterized protein CMU_008910 [Cryptosporidium muris RN66]EEA06399.1 hypothetical protein CMU_008910 [Cryptosporidium muris RN66]|eukprot:XP_002140748.1 hypothetical protein [Cryptosporidium muris RN66]